VTPVGGKTAGESGMLRESLTDLAAVLDTLEPATTPETSG
jgi:hypothetical protein